MVNCTTVRPWNFKKSVNSKKVFSNFILLLLAQNVLFLCNFVVILASLYS